jgi:ABC-type dipeptide/oligopeptide/nickel transport system permease subunit
MSETKQYNELNKNVFKRLMQDKFAFWGVVVLGALYLFVLFASFIAPYQEDYANRKLSYAPPSKVFNVTSELKPSWPYTYNYIRKFNPETYKIEYKLDKSKKYYIRFFAKALIISFLG